jgi:predicted kinase
MPANILLVTGPPCAGKSTVARRLRNSLQWPMFAHDIVSRVLYDALQPREEALLPRVRDASDAVMLGVARELAIAGCNCILAGRFRWSDNEARFRALIDTRKVRFVQVSCTAAPDVLVARWRARIARGENPHLSEPAHEGEKALRTSAPEELPLGHPAIPYDSSRDDPLRLDALVEEVKRRLAC